MVATEMVFSMVDNITQEVILWIGHLYARSCGMVLGMR